MKLALLLAALALAVLSTVQGEVPPTVVGSHVAGIAKSIQVLFVESEEENGCGKIGGCHKGYCWASCDATAFNNEWCYTTRGYSQDFKYVGCASDYECDKCWKCAGSCTA